MGKYNMKPAMIDGTPVGISIYSVTQEKPHYHEGIMEIIYCFKGNATIHISYEDIRLEEGDIISCDPHDVHCIRSNDDNLFISFYFDLNNPVFENKDLKDIFFVCERYVLKKEKQDELQNLKHFLLTMLYFYCFPHPKVSQTETFTSLSKKILDIMLKHFHFFDYMSRHDDYPAEAKSRFERILIYTNQNYQQKLTISGISQQEHLNSNYLSHFFRETTFLGYSNFINFVRIYHSEILLLDTSENISDISLESGFSDSKFYYRYFKKWYGHTPLHHRKYFYQVEETSENNQVYEPNEIASQLEHYISYYFATLHIPEFWNVPFIPFRNVPV